MNEYNTNQITKQHNKYSNISFVLKISNKVYTTLSYSKMCSIYWARAKKCETETQTQIIENTTEGGI
jgi:hypothetical protein